MQPLVISDFSIVTSLGAGRAATVAALQSGKERRERSRFAFEGPTLLEEAHASAFPIEEIYVTQAAYDQTPLVRELEAERRLAVAAE